jgi:hypothetical protein
MATNRVVFEVTDNGTLRALGAQATKAGQAMGNAAKGANTLDRNTKGAANASSNATKNFAKMAQGSNGLVAAYATLAANVFAVSAAFNFLKSAADFRVIQDAQVAFSSATGQGMKSLTRDLQSAAKGLLSFQDAAQAASIGVASGLAANQVEALAKGAANVSQILGRDVTDSFNRLVRGVTKAEPELLDELGITLRLADATEAYAATIGKRANQLTQAERRQAVFNDVQGQLEEKFNRVADAAAVEVNAIDKLGKAFDEVLNSIKSVSAALLEPVATFFAGNVKSLTAALGLLAIPLIKQILPGLDDWAETSKSAAKEASDAYRSSKKELEALAIAQKKITDPKASLQMAVSGVKSKGAGIQAIQSGKDLTERQRMSLLRAAENGKGVITQLSKEQGRVYIASLRAMGTENKKFAFSVRRMGSEVMGYGRRMAKTVEVQWKAATAAMSRASVGFARATNLVFRAAGFIGLITLFIDLTKSALEYLGLLSKNVAQDDMKRRVDDLTERLKLNNDEFSKFASIAEERLKPSGKIAVENFRALGTMLSSVKDNVLELNQALLETAVNNAKASRKLMTGTARRARRAGTSLKPQAIDLGDLETKAREELTKGLETLISGLDSTGISSLSTGAQLKGLAQTMLSTGSLTEAQAKEFERLSEILEKKGKVAAEVIQAENDLEMQYYQTINSITSYRTKYSDLIQLEIGQIQKLGEMAAANADVTEELDRHAQRLIILNDLRDLEYKKTLDKLKLDNQVLRDSRFATRNQRENINLEKQRVDLQNQMDYINKEINTTIKAGVVIDAEKNAILTGQLENLRLQKLAIEDQINATTRLGMEMKNAFEKGFQDGLANLIKNEETNMKKIIFGIAQTTLKAGADSLARTLTDKFMGKLFKTQTPEEKMKNAIVEGAREGAAIMKNAISGSAVGGGEPLANAGVSTGEAGGRFSLKRYLFGANTQNSITNPDTGEQATVAQRSGGIFGPFLTGMENLLGGKAPFLESLGQVFKGGLQGFGTLFSDLFSGLFGGGMSGGFGGILSSILPFSSGGIMNNGKKIPGYATGGIASGSGNGHLAMLHGTEAVVPLPNGKSIPVEGSTGNVNNVSITVNTEGNVQQTTQGGGEQGAALGKVIAAAVQSELQRQKRPGGLLSPYGAA